MKVVSSSVLLCYCVIVFCVIVLLCYSTGCLRKKRSLRISIPLAPTDASGDNSVGKGYCGDVG